MKNKNDITSQAMLELILEYVVERFRIEGSANREDFAVHVQKENYLLEAPWFMISVKKDPKLSKFAVMFSTSANSIIAAETIKTISFVLNPEEYIIGDVYFMTEEGVVYGEAALEAHEERVMENFGKMKCPSCDQFHFEQNIVDSGVCITCNSMMAQPGIWS